MIEPQETETEETAPRQAWCGSCDGPVDVDDGGGCLSCRENGDHGITELVVIERVAASSPRSIECPMCGADPGDFCHPGSDGDGYNHSERVEEHEEQFEVVASRPMPRGCK